jgi:hydrogenase expression/formation protein HypC
MCLAIPGQIVSIDTATEPALVTRTGRVSFGGIVKEVNLDLVEEARVGDYVIVHVGVALSMLDEDEARRLLADLQALDELGREDGGA